MDKELVEIIEQAKHFIEMQLKNWRNRREVIEFDGVQKTYPFTNEDISAILKLVDLREKENILSIMASGDQVFNFIADSDVKSIDTFDINRLTEFYVLGIKRAMVLKYSERLDFIYTAEDLELGIVDLQNDFILELLPFMDKRYAIFWKEIGDFYYEITKDMSCIPSLFKLLTLDISIYNIETYNDWLSDSNKYARLRERVSKVDITFKCTNAIDLPTEFSKRKYGLIYLSNIFDYFESIFGKKWTYEKFIQYRRQLENILSPDGVMFLQYIYYYEVFKKKREYIIDGSLVKSSDLIDGEEILSLIHNPNEMHEELVRCFGGIIDRRNTVDGMVLYRRR